MYLTKPQYRQDLQRECMDEMCQRRSSGGGNAAQFFVGQEMPGLPELPVVNQSMKIVAGCSSESLSAWIIDAASNPSTKR